MPLLIGINWFVIIFCTGTIVNMLDEWIYKKLGTEVTHSAAAKAFAFITDAALLTVFFDWLMEPVAVMT